MPARCYVAQTPATNGDAQQTAIADADPARWFVVQTKPRGEQRVCEHLAGDDVVTFLPQLLVRRRHGCRRWQALEPLFPCYIFARFRLESTAWSRIQWTPGVRRLLGGETPVPVDDEIVDYLRLRTEERGYIVPGRKLEPGTKVRFTEGPFDMLEGIIDRPVSRDDRVRVLLWMCGNTVSVEVSIDYLQVV